MENKRFIMTIKEVKTTLQSEQIDNTIKKDKKQVNQHLINMINYLLNKGINPAVEFEKTNTNRKNSKNAKALRFNSGVLFEILLNIAYDNYNNNLSRQAYLKKNAKQPDIIENGTPKEIKLVSKYSLSAPKNNDINDMLIAIIDDDGFRIKEITTDKVRWHTCNKQEKDGSIGKKIQVDKIQPNGIIRKDLMALLGY